MVRAAEGQAALPLTSLDKQCPASALAEAGSTAPDSRALAGVIAGGVVGGIMLLGLAVGASYAGCMLARRRCQDGQCDQALPMVSYRHSSMDGKVSPVACSAGWCMLHANCCMLRFVSHCASQAFEAILPGMHMSVNVSIMPSCNSSGP